MFFESGNKSECFGCEACVQVCAKEALSMKEDEEGFRYPSVNMSLCVDCKMCRKVCPFENMPKKNENDKYLFGGYNNDPNVRFESTSGGAFSAITDSFCDDNYVIFGAEAKGLQVFHSYTTDKREIGKYRKSKYSQSIIGKSFVNAKKFLKEGKKVLFSGTPCQIAGLTTILNGIDNSNLLTVEVVCEGVPSPLYIRKMDDAFYRDYKERIEEFDYRYTGKSIFSNGKWDFEQYRIKLSNIKKVFIKDRWFNPFWSVWLQHLMSRPSCYKCPFTTKGRIADITLGDLWGVHKFCPELYGKNSGSSLIVCNTEKGKKVFNLAKNKMFGHELSFEEAIKYQGPMRKAIPENPKRNEFISDLKSDIDFKSINKKWAKLPTPKLLFHKYVLGNRQKVLIWRINKKLFGK